MSGHSAYDELYAYYPEAAEILSVPEAVYTRPEVAFPGNANIVYKPYYFSPPVRFNELFEDWVDGKTNVDVLFNHSVVGINIKGAAAASLSMRDSSSKINLLPSRFLGTESCLLLAVFRTLA